jgi:hypothetical protein
VIAYRLIFDAAGITGLSVLFVAGTGHWPARWAIVAALASGALLVAWRGLCNVLSLNDDYMPLVSVADTGCLLAGALGPALCAKVAGTPADRWWLPAVAGGALGFVVNTLIL